MGLLSCDLPTSWYSRCKHQSLKGYSRISKFQIPNSCFSLPNQLAIIPICYLPDTGGTPAVRGYEKFSYQVPDLSKLTLKKASRGEALQSETIWWKFDAVSGPWEWATYPPGPLFYSYPIHLWEFCHHSHPFWKSPVPCHHCHHGGRSTASLATLKMKRKVQLF